MNTVFQFQEWVSSQSERAELALDRLLDSAQTFPHRLHEAMRYAAQGGGKRIRPLLVYAAGQLGNQSDVAQAESLDALLRLNVFTLPAHDDLPCMDDDDLRRGRPTVHKR
jgi:farnesyl diphosphate synthase